MFQLFNNNPLQRKVSDCAVRAISKALDIDWETAYAKLAMNGYLMGDMPNANSVWGALLRQNGFYRQAIPDRCPDCYTAEDFCKDYPKGIYVLGFGNHVATADWSQLEISTIVDRTRRPNGSRDWSQFEISTIVDSIQCHS